MTKQELLLKLLEEQRDKLFAVSGNYLMTVPKKGSEVEFWEHLARIEVLELMLSENKEG